MSNMVWTQERIEQIKKLWSEGLSAAQVAAAIGGISRSSVLGKVHRLGLSGRGQQNSQVKRRQRRTKPRQTPKQVASRRDGVGKGVRVPPLPVVRIVTPLVEPASKRVEFFALTSHICRYIADDTPPWTYCGHDVLPGSNWCEFHYQVCVQNVSEREARRRFDAAASRA